MIPFEFSDMNNLATCKLAAYYRNLARRCGYWAIARRLKKIGYSVDEARELLFG